ncbi:hypothetical protein NQ315_013886 [Exocentrus adspersus]|uniref:Uncharacterized protein n=1 Tax=Exocentrus adspersus TaxID=1586481 RepID=A0AAV8V5U4_9CUCU|nr:hypothetical protein NQ315_013886 [Exocentrus adspersus]
MDSESEEEIPQHVLEEAKGVALNFLPIKSRQRYEKEYTDFKKWMERNCVRKITEDSVLVYFSNRAKNLKPSSLWKGPNKVYISMKAVLLFALCGGYRCDELCKMTINDIQDRNDMLLQYIVNMWLPEIQKHLTLRFFVAFHQGKCTQQVMGKNTLAKIPCKVAQFLKL